MPIAELQIKHAAAGTTLWDDVLKGFGVRIGKRSKTFIVLIGSGRRQKIGRYPLISLSDARTEARRILAEKELGHVRPTHKAWDDARDDFLKHIDKTRRASTHRDYAWRLRRHFPFARKGVGDVTTKDIIVELSALKRTPAEYRYAFVVARAFFNWCIQQHIIERSPMEHLIAPSPSKARDRVLTDKEVFFIWQALPDDAFGTSVKLMILTGQRRNEIKHIVTDGDIATIDRAYTKNHRTHVFPVGPLAQHYLAKPRTFAGWGKAKARIEVLLPSLPHWTLHDLRRTFSTIHAAIGTPIHVTERLLNHISGTISGVAATYNRYTYMDEMKKAVETYEAHLSKILAPEGTS